MIQDEPDHNEDQPGTGDRGRRDDCALSCLSRHQGRNYSRARRHWQSARYARRGCSEQVPGANTDRQRPTNTIAARSQIIEASIYGDISYTSLKGKHEAFHHHNGTAILMGHDDLVEADGSRARKHLVRRTTDVYQRSGDDWPLVARRATFAGFDATPPAGPVATNYATPEPSPKTVAIQAQIEGNGRACGHAITTNDVATLEKLWSPSLVVNSPGNRILTREGVFIAMHERQAQIHQRQSVH